MSTTELIQALALLAMLAALSLIYWSAQRQDQRRMAERLAAHAAYLAALEAQARADWLDMCRQTREVDGPREEAQQ